MKSQHAVAAHWSGGWDDAGLQHWAEALRGRLPAPSVTLGLVFLSPQFFDRAAEVLEILRVHARIPLLVGCSSVGVIANGEEHQDDAGLSLALFHLPGARLRAVHFDQESMESLSGPGGWPGVTGVDAAGVNSWLVFADPFHLDGERWLREWNAAYPGIPTVGGLASGVWEEQRTQLYLNGDVHETGVIALAVGGEVRIEPIVSQGCTPIGDTWTITKADRQRIVQIANRPAYTVLVDTFNSLSKEDQSKTQGNLFVGFASSEYRDEFRRGDFLVRNLLGANAAEGTIMVGAAPRAGQTIQFQRRDATAATEDLSWSLARARERIAGRTVYGACLCCCNGRGARLFGRSNHDAGLLQEQLGPLPVAGLFCAGELGPVGERNFLHGYTAAIAVFVGGAAGA